MTAVVFAGAAYPAFHAAQQSLADDRCRGGALLVSDRIVCYKIFGLSEVTDVVLAGVEGQSSDRFCWLGAKVQLL